MALAQGPAGLDLSALAAQAGAETGTRVNSGQSALAGFLASMLQEQQGMLTSRSEEQIREQNFARAQALLDEALARRQASASSSGSSDGRDPALDLKMEMLMQQFGTDENIRQATTLAALERRYNQQDARTQAAAEASATRPHLDEFGASEINPYRGQAIQDRIREAPKGGATWRKPITEQEREALRKVTETYGLGQPEAVYKKAREIFSKNGRAGSSGRASLALWELGYKPVAAGG